MKRTLLDMVQSIMSDMDSDEVNSISDTVESEQVASAVRDSYTDIIDRRNWPHLNRLVQFDSSGTAARPTHTTLPDLVKELNFLMYNKAKVGETRRKYQPIKYAYPDEFLLKTNSRNNDNDNIDLVVDPTGVELLILNDTAPQWWTSFDDQTIVFDSYDSEVDTTIQSSKIQAQAYVSPTWTHEDSFIPDLPEEAFTLLLEESKSAATLKLKQVADQKAEQRATRQNSWLSRKAFKAKGGVRYPNYGRQGKSASNYKPQPLDKDN